MKKLLCLAIGCLMAGSVVAMQYQDIPQELLKIVSKNSYKPLAPGDELKLRNKDKTLIKQLARCLAWFYVGPEVNAAEDSMLKRVLCKKEQISVILESYEEMLDDFTDPGLFEHGCSLLKENSTQRLYVIDHTDKKVVSYSFTQIHGAFSEIEGWAKFHNDNFDEIEKSFHERAKNVWFKKMYLCVLKNELEGEWKYAQTNKEYWSDYVWWNKFN